jgi:hypothetical protein
MSRRRFSNVFCFFAIGQQVPGERLKLLGVKNIG